jgi:transcriptional regulator with XRE-family HTH domain
VGGDEFAGLLRELKERSGLSYGVLGKRLHLSASTLHRYVNGDAVPTDYAPVERLARICKATPQELVELHRRWVLADALRGQKAPGAGNASGASAAAGSASGADPEVVAASGADPAVVAASAGPADGESDGVPEVERGTAAEPPVRRRRRTVVLAGTAVAAAVVAAALVVQLVPGSDDDGKGQSVGAAVSTPTESASGTASAAARHKSPSPSASHTGDASASASAAGSGATGGSAGGDTDAGGAVPLTVATKPYVWDSPCGQPYLLNENPAQVPPPPNEQEAPGWIRAFGAVSGDEQQLTLSVQGTGRETAVLESLHVRVADKGAPLAWNSYSMGFIGVGCGGPAETKSFDVNLDLANPDAVAKAGQRDFPYTVSESDPEVFYVIAHAKANDVSWYLELDWSSGNRSGTLRIDDKGKPFRTSGTKGRPTYGYPLGGDAWERTEGD